METTQSSLALPDGRSLEVWAAPPGPEAGLLHIVGTPVAGLPWEHEAEAVRASGLRYITFSRPGYGTSTRRRGRTVADVADDVRAIADVLGVRRLHVVGHSGGGPHALACGGLLPDLVASVATIAGVAPWKAEGLDWLAGMGPENVEEFGAALEGETALEAWMQPLLEGFVNLSGDAVGEALGGLIDDVDRGCLTGDVADISAARIRRAVLNGPGGWIDDDLAFVRPWGFELDEIACPVAIWQGRHDLMVPFAHGEWLAANIPGAQGFLLPDEGHLTLAVARYAEIVADVAARGTR